MWEGPIQMLILFDHQLQTDLIITKLLSIIIMQGNQQTTRKKRKGISVSLSPFKKGSQPSQIIRSNTPMKQKIELQQSIISPQDLRNYFNSVPRYVRISPVIKSKENSNAKHNNDSTLRQFQERQRIALDEQLFILRSQIQNKKRNIQNLSSRQKHEKNEEPITKLKKYQQKSYKNLLKNQLPPRQQEKLTRIQMRINNAPQKKSQRIPQRIQKLRWAEQKLLDIIKICDNGL